ncbi:hypothetical protein [Rhodopirellula sallentina]|uniref:DUF1553 domain-containing protein n=1 Tax=Rhodopirellula sallentina SM41 TaxID=1263870 RepID=M5U9I6_9BACT|nr:hypothetical protein [Rhodopirellula sallentina]EMI58102.1 hypothetical protein RSSM_00462 [Rhodopirellula sallentina SM41]
MPGLSSIAPPNETLSEQCPQIDLNAAHTRAVARYATNWEAESLRGFSDRQLTKFRDNPKEASKFIRIGNSPSTSDDPARLAAWSQVCRVILNLHETITRY